MFDRQRFARECTLIEHGERRLDEPVDGNHLTGLHEQQVTADDVVERGRGELAVGVSVHRTRRAFEQGVELTAGASGGARFEGATARQHHGDHRAREVLADDERADEGENRERVDAEAPVPRRVDHPPRGRDHTDKRVGRPHTARGGMELRQIQHAAERQQDDRHDQQPRLEAAVSACHRRTHRERSRAMAAIALRRRCVNVRIVLPFTAPGRGVRATPLRVHSTRCTP